MVHVRSRAGVLIALAVAGLAGCGEDAAQPGAAVVTDSAGVRMVVNPDAAYDAAGEAWTLGETPEVAIGDVAGNDAVLFDRVMGIDRLSDGRWVVADMGSAQIRWYAPDGEPLFTAGSQGEGPQEFRQVMGMIRLAGDTLAIDDARSRFQLLSPEGEFTGTVGGEAGFGGPRTDLAGVLADGTPVAASSPAFPQRLSEPRAFTRGFHRATLAPDASGRIQLEVQDTIGTWEAVRFVPGWNESPQQVRFDGARHFALMSDGMMVGDPMSFELRFVSADGELRTVSRMEWTPRPVTDADIEKQRSDYINQQGEGGGEISPQLRQQRTEIADMWQFSDHMPAFSSLMVDRLDHIWLREYVPNEETVGLWWDAPVEASRWVIMDPGGEIVGRTETPARFLPRVIGEDFVAGLYFDEFEVEHVHSYPLTRR